MDEGCVQGILAKSVCFNGIYDENIIRNEINKIQVFDNFIVILYKHELKEKKLFLNNVFELHPLAVRSDKRNLGIGRTIVTVLEDEARKQGGLTIHLGADDEGGDGETSFANVDLYDDLPGKIINFNAGTHQSGFYLKLGYKIIGVMPDANGIGKPDIYFGKGL